MNGLVVIPARLSSTRLPRKVLLPLGGRPLLQRVYDQVRAARLAAPIVIATDSEEIATVARAFGGTTHMTPRDCRTGTDRAAFVLEHYPSIDWVLVVQADEPFIPPEVQRELVRKLETGVDMITVVGPPTDESARLNPSQVTAVMNQLGQALYFSRSPIPSRGAAMEESLGSEVAPWGSHYGLYGFRSDVLREVARHPRSALEVAEDLEQLRALEMGVPIAVVRTAQNPLSVNTEEDLVLAQQMLDRVAGVSP
jgi:3-deoxy-manno-octulosonate cytidylyltransferase (CMP-KDO synthetase)